MRLVFDLCLLHSPVLLKGFKVLISGIMVCYFVSSQGSKHSVHCIFPSHQSSFNTVSVLFFSSPVQVRLSDMMAIPAHGRDPVLQITGNITLCVMPLVSHRFAKIRIKNMFLWRRGLAVFVVMFQHNEIIMGEMCHILTMSLCG